MKEIRSEKMAAVKKDEGESEMEKMKNRLGVQKSDDEVALPLPFPLPVQSLMMKK